MKLVNLVPGPLLLVSCAQPKLRDDVATTREDVPVVIDVLANDSNVSPNELQRFATETRLGGSVRTLADGTFEFTPDADFEGVTGFDYIIDLDAKSARRP